MIITVFLLALALAALMQPNVPRTIAAVIFSGLLAAQDYWLGNTEGLLYYGSDALSLLLVVILTAGIVPVCRTVIRLHIICILATLTDLIGWVMWSLYLPPTFYDVAFLFIYSGALVTLILRDSQDVGLGDFTMDKWRASLRFGDGSWRDYIPKNLGKI